LERRFSSLPGIADPPGTTIVDRYLVVDEVAVHDLVLGVAVL